MGRKVQYFDHVTPQLGRIDGLTPRRAQVLEMVAQGLTTEDIALKLGISEDTVCAHLDHLRNQFSALNRVELIAQAFAHGVLCHDGARFSIGANVQLSSPLDHYAKRATERASQRTPAPFGAQKAVGPIFSEAAPGDSDHYEIPAYLRKRVREGDTPNLERVAAYAGRVQQWMQRKGVAA